LSLLNLVDIKIFWSGLVKLSYLLNLVDIKIFWSGLVKLS